MKVFDTDQEVVQPKSTNKSPVSGNNCDIFEPSVYQPDNSKFRADYIKRITPIVEATLDAQHLADELPDGEDPTFKLDLSREVTPEGTITLLSFIAKYLRGPRGFNGSLDNFEVMSEAEYNRLRVKDPNKFYFTYEGDGSTSYIEENVIITQDSVEDNILFTSNEIEDNVLIL